MDSRCHKPDKSGLPSGVRGAGAARFGLPSSLRGMPGVGCFNHCAPSGVVNADKSTAKAIVFISCLLRIAQPRSEPSVHLTQGRTPDLRRLIASESHSCEFVIRLSAISRVSSQSLHPRV